MEAHYEYVCKECNTPCVHDKRGRRPSVCPKCRPAVTARMVRAREQRKRQVLPVIPDAANHDL
jgi:rubrerythrin